MPDFTAARADVGSTNTLSPKKAKNIMNATLQLPIVREKLRVFISRFVRSREFNDGDQIFEAGFVNYMFVMELIIYIEKEFFLTVENDELELRNFASIDAMCDFIQAKSGISGFSQNA